MRERTFDGLADFTVFFERNAHGKHYIKASSSRLNDLFMRDLRDERFACLFQDEDRDTIEWLLDGVLDDFLPAVAGLAVRSNGFEMMNFEFVAHPFLAWGSDRAAAFGHLRPLKGKLSYTGPAPARLSLKSFRFLHPADPIETREMREEKIASIEPRDIEKSPMAVALIANGSHIDLPSTPGVEVMREFAAAAT
jgi:hypothetical protein